MRPPQRSSVLVLLLAVVLAAAPALAPAAVAEDVHGGDNVTQANQSFDAESGDAVGGALTVGVVSAGTASVNVVNRSRFSEARSGSTVASGRLHLVVGPSTLEGRPDENGPALTSAQVAFQVGPG